VSLIWATRGREWGFRFLLTGAFTDPLPEYDKAFSTAPVEGELVHRVGNRVALRILDPLGRQDRAGRVIPHDFVVFDLLADQVRSVEDGRRLIWPQVADEFERIWNDPRPLPKLV
jgi:hypothetical protein